MTGPYYLHVDVTPLLLINLLNIFKSLFKIVAPITDSNFKENCTSIVLPIDPWLRFESQASSG